MGSFPVTCAISGLPINYGDGIRFFALTQSPFHDEHTENHVCMMDELWFVRTLPLACVYNDSACITDVPDGPQRDSWMMGFQIDLIEGTQDSRKLVPPTSKNMDFDTLVESLSEGAVWVLSDGARRYTSEQRHRLNMEIIPLLKRDIGDFPAHLEFLSVSADEQSPELIQLRVLPVFVREDVWQALLKVYVRGLSLDALTAVALQQSAYGDRPPFQVSLFTHLDLLHEKYGRGNVPASVVSSIAEFIYINAILSRVGFVWRPSTRADQQQVDWDMHARFHKDFARIARIQHRRENGILARLWHFFFPA